MWILFSQAGHQRTELTRQRFAKIGQRVPCGKNIHQQESFTVMTRAARQCEENR